MSTEKVRIVNDNGVGYTTKITNADTGEIIPHVYNAEVEISVDGPIRARLHTYMPIVDIVADADITTHCPYCKQEVKDTQEKASPVVGMMDNQWKEVPRASHDEKTSVSMTIIGNPDTEEEEAA